MASLEDGAEQPFFLVSRDDAGQVIGGLQGLTLYRWLKIEIMAVHPDARGRGIGTQLMKAAEQRGIECGCDFAYVDTMSHQAPAFYRGLGYLESGRLEDWDSHGHDKFFFTKALNAEA